MAERVDFVMSMLYKGFGTVFRCSLARKSARRITVIRAKASVLSRARKQMQINKSLD